jgi:hypothetical protein
MRFTCESHDAWREIAIAMGVRVGEEAAGGVATTPSLSIDLRYMLGSFH